MYRVTQYRAHVSYLVLFFVAGAFVSRLRSTRLFFGRDNALVLSSFFQLVRSSVIPFDRYIESLLSTLKCR